MFKKKRVAVFAGLNLMAKPNVPATTIVGIIAGKNIHVRINSYIINVTQAMGIHFHFFAIWSNPYNSSTVHGQLFAGAVNCIAKTKISHCNINPAVNPHSYAIGCMVGAPAL